MGTAERKLARRLLVARVGATLAVVPRNGPQHQPCYLRARGRQLRGPRVPHAVTGRPASWSGISPMSWPPRLLQLPPPAQPRSQEGSHGWSLPHGTGPGREEPVTRRDVDTSTSGPPALAGLGQGPSLGASPSP